VKPARLVELALTLPRLGVANLLRVAVYRVALGAGLYRRLLPIGAPYSGAFWVGPPAGRVSPPDLLRQSVLARAARIRSGLVPYFSSASRDVGFPPDWLRDAGAGRPLEHWSGVSEFAAGDIKLVWELSRFDVLPVLAASLIVEAPDPPVSLLDLDAWLTSWVETNPANAGPNWRCAQETALRLINTLVADQLLRRQGARHGPALERFVMEHCARIRPTMVYAIAQDNNHATSEAVGLYVGGGWLNEFTTGDTREFGRACMRIGRRAFERSTRRLVLPDGSFAQHSVNYHRLYLDTASVLEVFRREFEDAPFAADVRVLLDRAARWLAAFTDPASGDAPNLGANDGARLLQLGRTGYRDFRPHAQLAAALFSSARAWGHSDGEAENDLLFWFGVTPPRECLPATGSALFPFGGYALLVKSDLRVFVRLPVFRFRPSHSDILHVDVWWKGENIVRDGGTYSYNTTPEWMAYFPGVASHSTVQFSTRDQMPRLSRFLFGCWPEAERLAFSADDNTVSCGYSDRMGARHWRQVSLVNSTVIVKDVLDTREANPTAVSRLRLRPGAWRIEKNGAVVDGQIRIVAGQDGDQVTLATGFESRSYDQMDGVAVVERRAFRFPHEDAWRMTFG
jgi:hypothetical protein